MKNSFVIGTNTRLVNKNILMILFTIYLKTNLIANFFEQRVKASALRFSGQVRICGMTGRVRVLLAWLYSPILETSS